MLSKWEELIFQRDKNGLSLESLSQLCDIPVDALEKIEQGIEEVNELQLESIAQALSISPVVLLGMETTSANEPVESRFRIYGNQDINLEKSFNFGLDLISKIEELKYLNSID